MRSRAGKMIKDTEEQAKKIATRETKLLQMRFKERQWIMYRSNNFTVDLPDDELKGRIGKEGRNIRPLKARRGRCNY